jgi:choline dehydrogenase-like flavoprotein
MLSRKRMELRGWVSVDASVRPTSLGTYYQAAVYAVAEQAADMDLSDR